MLKTLRTAAALLLPASLLITTTFSAFAAPVHQGEVCAQDYVVQANDWLSKLAEKQYGDPFAYTSIVEATNAAAAADESFATIDNPDVIEVGWRLCLTHGDEASQVAAGPASFRVTVENIGDFAHSGSGVFNTPASATEPGPLLPGDNYSFSFNAAPGDRISFATMLVQSNDWFVGAGQEGIALFNDDGSAVSGDITEWLYVLDSGTEIDQTPGEGVDQAPRQSGPDTGDADPDNTVRIVSEAPAVTDLVQVTLDNTGDNSFTITIQNVSDQGAFASPFAPGVWVVHTADAPLYAEGAADYGLGLEALAEDGNPGGLAEALASESGLVTPLAPGVWAVHTADDVLFTDGAADFGLGLEALAEDGNPAGLAEALSGQEGVASSGAFNTPVGASEPGPLLPGNAYEFTFDAEPGDNLSFATMFVHSNDLFFGPDASGIALFTEADVPITGDITAEVSLWDAGTEANEVPGFGPNQAPRQGGPNTGADEAGVVQIVDDGYSYPATDATIKITISVE